MIVATTIVIKEQQILLIKKYQTNRYGMPGGKAEHNELPIKTAIREFTEETGLKILSTNLKVISEIEMKTKSYTMYTFMTTKFTGTNIESNHEGVLEWVDLDKLDDLLMYEGDKSIIKFAMQNQELGKMHFKYDENTNLVEVI